MQGDPNYGRQEEEETRVRRVSVNKDDSFGGTGGSMGTMGSSGTMSLQDERTWSMLSHLSVLLNLITGIGGPVAALVIWLIYKDRSPRVGFHALQSLWYQVAWLVILGVGWTITGILTIIIIGFLLIPVMAILSIVPFVHQIYAAIKVNGGVDYRYPFIADMVDGARRFG